jgi:hypothetical protein
MKPLEWGGARIKILILKFQRNFADGGLDPMELRLRALKSILCPAPSRALSSSPKMVGYIYIYPLCSSNCACQPYPTVVPSQSKGDLKMTSEYVRVHSDGYSRTIELNRPAALNSLNYGMVHAITEAIKVRECRPSVPPPSPLIRR